MNFDYRVWQAANAPRMAPAPSYPPRKEGNIRLKQAWKRKGTSLPDKSILMKQTW
jgi:hypothetical protein